MRIKYTKTLLEELVKISVSTAQVLTKLGLRLSGGNYSHISNKIKEYGIDKSHFLGKAANCGVNHKGGKRKKYEEILVLRISGRRCDAVQLRRALIESGREYKCELCGLGDEWNGKSIRLEVDHKNNNWLDDRSENLRFCCPNCHSQQFHKYNQGLTGLTTRRIKRSNGVKAAARVLGARPERGESAILSSTIRTYKTKIKWPNYEELLKLVEASSYSAVGRFLGVSDNAIRKRLKNHK